MVSLLLVVLSILCFITQADKSIIILSDPGYEFVPINSISLILTSTAVSSLRCGLACNQRIDCRTYDFDLPSGQCRLFEADLTTGSIVASPYKPQSIVGSVQISTDIYSLTYGQPCNQCAQSRYEVCYPNSTSCQCPMHTYWNGTICAMQLFDSQSCSNADACRSDLNSTCVPCYVDQFTVCGPMSVTPYGTTMAGYCDGSAGSGSMGLYHPHGLFVTNNGTIYVADTWNYRVQAFLPNSLSGVTILNHSVFSYPMHVATSSDGSTVYMSDNQNCKVYIWPHNQTIPPLNSSFCDPSCALNQMYLPSGLVVDQQGNVYVAQESCNNVVKWAAPNATAAVVVAGTTNVAGSSSTQLNKPFGIDLDENKSALYVCDQTNQRIQKFLLNTNSTVGITVAGGNGAGSALNQLNSPSGVYVSRIDGSVYVSDTNNHRIVRWSINATEGVIVAGSQSETGGNTALLLYYPCDIKLDAEEKFLYVADADNNRIQRFPL